VSTALATILASIRVQDEAIVRAQLLAKIRISEGPYRPHAGSTSARGWVATAAFEDKRPIAYLGSFTTMPSLQDFGSFMPVTKPRCCNPLHLRLGAPKMNMADCVARGRHRNGSPGASVVGGTTNGPS
jgi:hypothetical protein